MTWVQTFSGVAFELLSPTASRVRLVDIAHSLSRLARFNGHTTGALPWSVAQHSLLAESLLPEGESPDTKLHALLHDAHEAYVGDITSPVRRALQASMPEGKRCDPLRSLCFGIDNAVWQAFELYPPDQAQVKAIREVDFLVLRIEKEALLAPEPRDWGLEWPDLPYPVPKLEPIEPDVVKAMFIARAQVLMTRGAWRVVS